MPAPPKRSMPTGLPEGLPGTSQDQDPDQQFIQKKALAFRMKYGSGSSDKYAENSPAPESESTDKLKQLEGSGGGGGAKLNKLTMPASGEGEAPGASTAPAEGTISNYSPFSDTGKMDRIGLKRERMGLDMNNPADRLRMQEIDEQLKQMQSPQVSR